MMNEDARATQVQQAEQPELENQDISKSLYELMWRRFLRNKVGVACAILLILIYMLVIFANFFVIYPIDADHIDYIHAPPQRIRIFHAGKLARPFVYAIEQKIDPVTFRIRYENIKSRPYPLQFFARGHEYKLFGIFTSRLHLIQPPDGGSAFLLGTDRLGRCLLSRILKGMQVSLTIPLLGTLISVVIGSIVGTVSGYFGGMVDMAIQRVIEFIMSFPRIPLWLTLSAALPPNWDSIKVFIGIVIILSFIGWAGLARQVRAKVLSTRRAEYVLAAKAAGSGHGGIILSHLVPSCYSHIIVIATLSIPRYILAESSLSFLGLGIKPPMTSLGVLLREAQTVQTIVYHPWLLIPGIVIVLSILAFNFVGDALRDAADPLQSA